MGLVQTDVMVFDRHGNFQPDLKVDQFELRVDGKVQPVSFLELVSTGSPHDEEVWAKAEGKPVSPPPQTGAPIANPGRTLLIFLDDWHLSADSVMRSRSALSKLIETSMGPNDRVAVVAASGQLAAMAQLTSDKAAVLSSVQKFNFQSPGVEDLHWPPMTETQAMLIEHNDLDVITYFVSAIVGQPVEKTNSGWRSVSGRSSYDIGRNCADAEKTTRRRATELAQVSTGITSRTLSAMRAFLRTAETVPGRKLVFFLSDGFVLQPQQGDVFTRVTDLTTAAARTGIVIYTLDARGLVVGLPDAKTKRAGDMTGALAHSGANEVAAPQDALNAFASDTGGRFMKNTNALDAALITALSENSRYYLLGWHVDPELIRPGKASRIRVTVKGRSDLSVRVRQGSLDLSQLITKGNK